MENQILTKQNKLGDSGCNRMDVIGNLKFHDGGHPPCLILKFAANSKNYRKSNSEENIKFGVLGTIDETILAI